jgi:transcriptional regulator with XRE-family HTH domain
MTDVDSYAVRRAIGVNIRRLRTQAGMSQEDASARLGVSQTAWSRWEAGQHMPSADRLPTVARVLDASVVDLLAGVPA